jgi:hypothetical protein
MHGLEVPKALPRARVESQQTVAEQVGSDAVRAIEIVGGRTEREVGDAAFFVDRNLTPGIHGAGIFPGVGGPSLIPKFSGLRDGVERPRQFAAEHVIGAQIAWRGAVPLAGRRSQNDEVLEDAAGRSGLNAVDRFRITP